MTNTTTLRTLFFEGAGWDGADSSKATDLANCRLRTAFTNNDGKAIYLEVGAQTTYDKKNNHIITAQKLVISHLFYITGDNEDCNINHINFDWNEAIKLDYTRENLTNWINSTLNCNFDTVQTLQSLGGYRVHRDGNGYNFGDTFEHDPMLTAKREAIHDHYYALEASEGKKYPNFSLWVDPINKHLLHLLRHFEGHNRHWGITTSGEAWEAAETKLGMYGC